MAPPAHDLTPTRRSPTRTCVACRTERDKRDLVRIVRGADGTVRMDATGKASGRGAYLCADPACWTKAAKSRAVQRALAVTSSETLTATLAAGPPPEFAAQWAAREVPSGT
jgi:predicted RNA-binding protein YlxR (DUF448 family)